ncbi:MAG: hypothetical protein PHY83_05580, partial [Bacilli bacterium]|nr:hypothetical protein [Bacilli bacterium]
RTWTPIGDKRGNEFSGTIDGNGYKISGLSNTGYVGGVNFTSYAGTEGITFGFIAYAKGKVTISNLNLDVNISGEKTNLVGAAGLIGQYNNWYYDTDGNSVVNPNYPKEQDDTSFPIAYDCEVTIANCVVDGSISGNDKVAGLIGSSYISIPVSQTNVVKFNFINCTNNAYVSYVSPANDLRFRSGGFIGTNASSVHATEFVNCTNNGTIDATGSDFDSNSVGQILGKNSGTIDDPYAMIGLDSCNENGAVIPD